MTKQTIQPIRIYENFKLKYENMDFLDLIYSERLSEKGCERFEFHIGSPNRANIQNLKYKLEYLKLQTVGGYKSHFKKQCFNCSSSFFGSRFEDGFFNFQKILEVGEKCVSCRKNYTTQRLFCHVCNTCSASFKTCKLLAHHHSNDHNSTKPHQCAVCNLSLSDGAFYPHIYKHTRPNVCPYCNKRYAVKRSLIMHMRSHTGEKPYSCKYCSKQYKAKESLDYHLFEHTGGKQFKCDLCDKTFAKQFKLNKHKSIHMGQLFQCKYCPKQFKGKRYLAIHLFEHTGGKQFKCDLCDKSFAKRNLLKLHESTHLDKSFKCEYCPKQYKTIIALNLHVFEHIGGNSKQFKCDLCDKIFAKLYLLNRHKSIHLDSFQCKYCIKTFKRKRSLDYHIFEHTGGKQFKCDLCDKTFAKSFALKRHKSIHLEK